jgi:hypothetical protein
MATQARAMMSDRRGRYGADQFTALGEARAILSETEHEHRYAPAGTESFYVDWTRPGVAPIFYSSSSALADSLRAFISADDPAAYLRGRQ